ncbi:hypothetical protein MTR_1g110500 [Medicago truncatula]|uniref:Uncharacterized protein n=1 Tax=Medicago truncatula TaxID=3880 RepID=G7ID89_MEDTR|nr:hypothetical protein MTR_1g110500 [Medicago truncatula]
MVYANENYELVLVCETGNNELYTTLFMLSLYYQPHIYADNASRSNFSDCTNVLLPIKDLADAKDPFTFITVDTLTEVKITEKCANCHFKQRGRCEFDNNGRFHCANDYLYLVDDSLLLHSERYSVDKLAYFY